MGSACGSLNYSLPMIARDCYRCSNYYYCLTLFYCLSVSVRYQETVEIACLSLDSFWFFFVGCRLIDSSDEWFEMHWAYQFADGRSNSLESRCSLNWFIHWLNHLHYNQNCRSMSIRRLCFFWFGYFVCYFIHCIPNSMISSPLLPLSISLHKYVWQLTRLIVHCFRRKFWNENQTRKQKR